MTTVVDVVDVVVGVAEWLGDDPLSKPEHAERAKDIAVAPANTGSFRSDA